MRKGGQRPPLRDLCVFILAFLIYLCLNRSARKMPDCKRYAFLSYFPCLSPFLSLRSVSCFIINSTLHTPNSTLSIVGSAHTRTLFLKSVAKTFVFFLIYLCASLGNAISALFLSLSRISLTVRLISRQY